MNAIQSRKLKEAIKKLSQCDTFQELHYERNDSDALPSSDSLEEIVRLCRSIIFPGYFGDASVNEQNLAYHIGINTEKLFILLVEQIKAGLSFSQYQPSTGNSQKKAEQIVTDFVSKLPDLQDLLAQDVIAAYKGDPAAESIAEVIVCYPGLRAISSYRIAHLLLELGVPIIPRMITELAHRETGIDIHPAAAIGSSFSIDHGTGVVIGATSIIGSNVKLYQGVTLGAKSFPLDENGNPIKGVPRHPILEDNVIVYSNATILGRITIGKDATIGGNIWVTEDVAAGTKIIQSKKRISDNNTH